MKRVLSLASLIFCIALSGCGRDPAPAIPLATSTDQPADPAFVGKVWISATPGAALGSMLIFLPDRTLVMDSCFETYRLTKWGIAGDHIRWIEDTIPIEAAVEMPRPHQLILKISGRDTEESYFTATVPYTCPSMR